MIEENVSVSKYQFLIVIFCALSIQALCVHPLRPDFSWMGRLMLQILNKKVVMNQTRFKGSRVARVSRVGRFSKTYRA